MLRGFYRADRAESRVRSAGDESREWTGASVAWRNEQPAPASSSSSDAAVTRLAERTLYQKDFRFSRCVACEYHDGVLTLNGRVPTYYLKQLAQAAVAGIEGVDQVDNCLDVFIDSNPLPRRPR